MPTTRKPPNTWVHKRGVKADPLLQTQAWRVTIRNHFRGLRLPCQAPQCYLPRVPIDYDGPTYVIIRGRRTTNRASLHVGHIVSRREAKQRRWTPARINALSNLRPEHAMCSVKAGAREGNEQSRKAKIVKATITSRTW